MPADDLRPALAAAQMFEAHRASRDLGMELIEVGDGRATVRMTSGVVTVAAGADISCVAPAREGDLLEAAATERAASGAAASTT